MRYLISLLGCLAWLLVGATVGAAPPAQRPDGEPYVVQADDWLSKLAEKYYGDMSLYPVIVEATNARAEQDEAFAPITNPDWIEVGQKLWIPARDALPTQEAFSDPDTHRLAQVAEIGTAGDSLAFSPDDKLLALGNWQGVVQVWETGDWRLRWETSHEDAVHQVAFSPDGQRLATVSFDGTARLWDAVTGAQIAQLDFDYWVYGLDFSADGRHMATGGLDGKVILADGASGRPIQEFKHDFQVKDLEISPGGPWLAVMTSGSWGPAELVVWDIFTNERRTLAEFVGPPSHSNLAFSPDAKWLAAAMSYGDPVTIWETQIWPQVAQLERPAGSVMRLAFSPDGRWLAGVIFNGEMDTRVWVWDVPTWQVVSEMAQADVVHDLAFSPDGRWLVTGLGQGIEHPPANEGQLWDVASGTLVARMPHDRQVLAVEVSHDGKWIATGSNDGTVRIWRVP
jgi:WD40 repeat protein